MLYQLAIYALEHDQAERRASIIYPTTNTQAVAQSITIRRPSRNLQARVDCVGESARFKPNCSDPQQFGDQRSRTTCASQLALVVFPESVTNRATSTVKKFSFPKYFISGRRILAASWLLPALLVHPIPNLRA